MSEESLRERLGALDAKLTAAHARLDKVEQSVSLDLQEIKKDLKIVVAWMNRSLGWAAAFIFVGGILGALLTALIEFFKK